MDANTTQARAARAQPANALTNTSRSVMQKKFKINDGASKHVEQSTLLEPGNNATAMQNDQDEIREVSVQLSQIKKKHDEAKKLVLSKQDELEKIKKEIEMLSVQENQCEVPVFNIRNRLEQLQNGLDGTKLKIDEETMQKNCYVHMLHRMKSDQIATLIKSSEMENSLKSKQQILDIEQGKHRKATEEKLQSKATFDALMKNIEKEQKDRQERILELQKCIKNKEESVQRRIERQRRNQEIAEAAANENKDSSELKMRENLFIQKLWNSFMRKKMEKEMRNSQQIDDAFKAIKTTTGVTDVQEMVRKFLTREQTYSQLLMAVSESERKIDKLKKDNEELRGRLHELQIDSDGAGTPTTATSGADEEILTMNDDLGNYQKEYSLLQEKFKKVNIVNDQISGWAKRVFGKIGDLVKNEALQHSQEDMVKVFETLSVVVCGELQNLLQDGGLGDIEYGDVFTDFATEEFIGKNIRVRPVSGVTHADETKDGRASNVSKGGNATEGNEDGEDNYNKFAILELEDQRKAIKLQQREKAEELKRKKALEAKEAEAKKNR